MSKKIIINGKEFEFEEGETVYKVAKRNGIFIPTYCYHSQLRIVASCRICLVEVKVGNKEMLITSCSTLAQDGMIVYTDSEKVLRERYAIMQFLLLNHPPECPVCDEGGNCLLQDYTEKYGPTSPFFKYKKEYKKYDIGPLIRFYPELCILCDRCYRFWKEELNEDEIVSKGRGINTYIGPNKSAPILKGFSNYLVDICPVGAFLDNTTSKFCVRPWDLEEIDTCCPFCSLFCEIRAYPRKKIRTRAVEGGKKTIPDRIYNIKYQNKGEKDSIICDRGKFGKDFLISERVLSKVKIEGEWRDIDYRKVLSYFKKEVEKQAPESVGVIISARLGNEEISLLKNIFVNRMGIRNFLLVPGILNSSANFMLSDFNPLDIKERVFILHTGYDFFYSHPVIGFEILRRLRKFPEKIIPSHFKKPPFEKIMPFLFSISYQEGKVIKEANEFFLTNFKNSFKLLSAIFSELQRDFGVRREIEDVLLNSLSFLKKVENLNIKKICTETGFDFEKLRNVINRIKSSDKLIILFQDFIPFEIQKLLFIFKYLNFPVKSLILRFSPNTEYLLEKCFPLINLKEFEYKLERGILKFVIFIYTNPFLEIYPFSSVRKIFERCKTFVLDTFKGLHTELSQNVIPLKSMFERKIKVKDNFGREKTIERVIESERIELRDLLKEFGEENYQGEEFLEKFEIELYTNFEDLYLFPSLYNFGYEVLFSETLKRVEKPSFVFFPFEDEKRAEEFEG